MKPQKVFRFAVAAFVVYNSVVILWELNKRGSTVCNKCAITRLVVGAGVGLAALALPDDSRAV